MKFRLGYMKFSDEIQKNENLTILLIAHRLSTVQNADQIIVIDKGQVVEIGKHTELMKKKGFYFNLVSRNDFSNAFHMSRIKPFVT